MRFLIFRQDYIGFPAQSSTGVQCDDPDAVVGREVCVRAELGSLLLEFRVPVRDVPVAVQDRLFLNRSFIPIIASTPSFFFSLRA